MLKITYNIIAFRINDISLSSRSAHAVIIIMFTYIMCDTYVVFVVMVGSQAADN